MKRKDGLPKKFTFTKCSKCQRDVNNVAYNRHFKACKGIYKQKEDKKINYDFIKIEGDVYACLLCEKNFSKKGIGGHYWKMHTEEGRNTKNGRLGKKGTNSFVKARLLGLPNPIVSEETKLKIGNFHRNKKLSEEHKRKISEKMKIAHKEKRAWNIGKNRWKKEKSYPEKFFIKVIENEFLDKNYTSEYWIYKYCLDFAWIDLKKVIEIDGDQHLFENHIIKDKEKDSYLISQDWKILRIRWKDMYNNPKSKIKEAYDFIHD